MSKKLKFTITTIWILFSRSYDAYCTSLYTPDLSQEANPLVSVLGFGWTSLIITLTVLTIITIYAYYISVFKPMNLFPKEKGYSFNNFIAYLYLGKKDNWFAMIYKLPKDFKRFLNYMGHVFTPSLAFAGIVSTIMWLLINSSEYYLTKIHSPALIYSIIILGIMVISYNWYRKMYAEYEASVIPRSTEKE